MSDQNHLPPWTKRDNFSVDRHQAIVDALNASLNVFPDGDSESRNGPFGKNLAALRRILPAPWAIVRLTGIQGTKNGSNVNLGGGWYSGRAQTPKAKTYDPTGNMDLSAYWQDVNSVDDLYIEYLPESVSGGSSAQTLPTGGSGKIYLRGQFSGFSDNPSVDSRPIIQVPYYFQIGVIFVVALTQTGGSNGTQTTAASWTYTAKSLDGSVTYGTALSPQRTRWNGSRTAATLGYAYFDNTGTFKLAEPWEPPGTGHC